MLTVSAALQLVLEHASRRPVETAELAAERLGQVLAADVVSDLDMPPFAKALVDGYAVRLDADAGSVLRVVEEIPAGSTPRLPLHRGEAARIMTGAMTPEGAEAVVMVERTESLADGHVRIFDPPLRAGQNILPQGREMRAGEIILAAGTVIRPQEIGLLAATGAARVQVYQRPRVAVLATGDELVEPAQRPGPGQIRNSNGLMLAAQVLRSGAKVDHLGIARDNLESHRSHIALGLEADVLLLSGGVSAGKLDLVPAVLAEMGVTAIFHKIIMKPGKPLFFGVRGDTLVFGLPGNPVSSLVGFELLVRPALRKMLGRHEPGPRMVQAILAADFEYSTDRPTYHPARLEQVGSGMAGETTSIQGVGCSASSWQVSLVPWFGSADLRSIGQANSFAVLAAGSHRYLRGQTLEVLAPELSD